MANDTANIFKRGPAGFIPKGKWKSIPGTYWLRYMVDGQVFQQSLECRTLEEAKEKRAVIMAGHEIKDQQKRLQREADRLGVELERAKAAEDAAKRNPLATLWDRFPLDKTTGKGKGGAVRELSEHSAADNRRQWDRFVAYLADQKPPVLDVREVTPALVQAWNTQLRQEISHNRANKHIITCNAVFRLAGIAPNPFDKAERFQLETVHREALTADEVRAILDAVKLPRWRHLRTLFYVGMFTGLRLGDAVRLDWNDIDLNRGQIYRATRKSGKRISIPLFPDLAGVLAETPPEARRGLLLPELAALHDNDTSAVSKRVKGLFNACGIDTQHRGDGEGRAVAVKQFHALRTTFITECAKRGVPLGALRDWIGHQSTEITRVYERWSQGDQHAAIVGAFGDFAQAATGRPAITASPAPAIDITASPVDDTQTAAGTPPDAAARLKEIVKLLEAVANPSTTERAVLAIAKGEQV